MPTNRTASTARMSALERLTWDQICKRYPDEWVVLVETEWANDTDFAFTTALVIAHHQTRKAASPDIKAAFQRYPEVGSFYTGRRQAPLCCSWLQ